MELGIFWGRRHGRTPLNIHMYIPIHITYTCVFVLYRFAKAAALQTTESWRMLIAAVRRPCALQTGSKVWCRLTYLCLSLHDRVCRMTGISGFPWKIQMLLRKCRPQAIYPSWHHIKQTCFILDFQEHVFTKVQKMHLSGAGKVQNEKWLIFRENRVDWH